MNRHLTAALAGGIGAAVCGLASCAVHAEPPPSAACIVPGVPAEYYVAVVQQESGGDPLALHQDDPPPGAPYHPATVDEAERIAKRLLAQGHSVGVGLGQLTARSEPAFEAKFGLSVREALANPCANMRAGSALLQKGLRAALSTYNCGGPDCAPGYVRHVLARVPGVSAQDSGAAPSPPAPRVDLPPDDDPTDPRPPRYDLIAFAEWKDRRDARHHEPAAADEAAPAVLHRTETTTP